MVDFVGMEVIVALMVVKIVVMIMVMMVDMMGDMMGDMMVIMEMVPGDWRRDAPGGVDDVEQRRRERPVRASQRGAGRLHRGWQEPHHQHREEAVEEVEAEEGDDPEDDGGLAQPDEEVVLHKYKIQNTEKNRSCCTLVADVATIEVGNGRWVDVSDWQLKLRSDQVEKEKCN